MLRQRILTGILLGVLLLGLILATSFKQFALITALITLAASWEFFNLASIERLAVRGLCVGVMLLLVGGSYWLIDTDLDLLRLPLALSAIVWLLPIPWLVRYPEAKALWQAPLMRTLWGWWSLMATWLALAALKKLPNGEWHLLYFFALVAAADIGAFAIGRTWGQTKLAPRVSPGKTWEGFAGGLGATLALAAGIALAQGLSLQRSLLAMGIAAVTMLFSVVGDLSISMLKRYRGVKDSSHLLPGHGGLLDRLDSICAAAPWFAWVMLCSSQQVDG
jgi:phosphatidate cytidylyltransferase